MGIYRDSDNVIQKLAELKRCFEEVKTRQFIGSNQIVMYPYETNNTWDITLVAKYPGQAVGSPGFNLAIITARALESDNLVADIVPTFSIAMPLGGGWINIPQPAELGDQMQWYVPIFATLGSSVSIKIQVISNTPVEIIADEVG